MESLDIGKYPGQIYDFENTIEGAAEDLAAYAEGRPTALFIDSLQTVTCSALQRREKEPTAREVVEANVRAFRKVVQRYGMFGLATSESNRAGYSKESNPMSAGAESRAIEFSAETLISLTLDQKNPDVTWAEVPKNRRYSKGSFAFRLEKNDHAIQIVDYGEIKRAREQQKTNSDRRRDLDDMIAIIRGIAGSPGCGHNELKNIAKLNGVLNVQHRVKDLTDRLAGIGAVVRFPGPNNGQRHYLDGSSLPPDIATAVPEARDLRPPAAEGV